ncbi:hypothetical protein ACE7GA_01125 [Roseomonas sp. CCTCC AB2023176]|uniref:hypothetical protein n=1 Tax=Roseomonas sp. CCTCC AB2023176 TaxID=3342640 RepID=UPI0035DC5894
MGEATAAALARARDAASALETALAELCHLGSDVKVRVEPGFTEGRTRPSVFFVEVEVD